MIISPVPTHPTIAGNRRGVLHLSDYFTDKGYDVTFCYLAFESFSFEKMSEHFNHQFFVINKDELFDQSHSFLDKLVKICRKFKKGIQWCKWKSKLIDADKYMYNSDIDVLFLPSFLKKFKKKVSTKWDIVVCEYVWTSKLLTIFPVRTIKIIDTHDCFINRYKIYQEIGVDPTWYSFNEKNEFFGLKRSDIILALTDTDKVLYERKCKRKVVNFFYTPEPKILPAKDFSYTLLYFASSNINNIKSIHYFVDHIFPEIKLRLPQVKLLIGGGICQELRFLNPSIYLMGFCEDANDFYKLGDISINPEISGTGFKIKMIESLSYGKPTICSESSLRGIKKDSSMTSCFLIANNADEYVDCITFLFNYDNYKEMQQIGIEYLNKIRHKTSFDLNAAIEYLSHDK